MNKFITAFFILLLQQMCTAQAISTQVTSTKTSISLQWNNYSTSFNQQPGDSTPFIVTATPYNGKYAVADENAPLDVSFKGSEYRYQSMLQYNYHSISTYDSSDVFFFVPYIRQSNAALYEYRVLQNGDKVLKPWSSIDSFTSDTFQLYVFKKVFAQLGGYRTTWDKYLTVELRRKGADTLIAAAAVYWKQVKPSLLNIYTSNELNDFLLRMKESYTRQLTDREIKKWQQLYKPDELDTLTHLPKKLSLASNDNNIIFYLKGNIYKKEALEYQLVHDDKVMTDWKPNDFDNNIIWLNNLPPGNFILRMRFSGQRHNVTDYQFEIKPAWHQTTLFKVTAGGLIAAFFGFIIVLFRLNSQKRKTAEEQSKKHKLHLELKAIHSQLNPHFVFNALTSIQGLVNNNNIAGANRYLSKFASLMRDSLTGGDKDFISLEKEIVTLETYLSLEQLRFGFTYTIDLDKTINASETDIPALLLQPLVENAVKHGAALLEEKGIVKISFKREDNNLIIVISDNGKGYAPAENSNGYGLRLTKERISLLNEILPEQPVSLNIEGAVSGTTVHLQFKNWWL